MKLKNNSTKKISTFSLVVYLFILEIRDESGLRRKMMEEIRIPKLANYIIYIFIYINFIFMFIIMSVYRVIKLIFKK